MHSEFMYFYPLDSRHSGRDLVPNHLTFMIFNHTAIFPEKLWPRQIATNGSVMMEGAKMSKSFGNIIPLREGVAKFGADPIRLSVLSTAELLQDAEFSPAIAKSMRERLERMYKFTSEVAKSSGNAKTSQNLLTAIDRWMLSRLQEHIRKATEAMDKLAVRKTINSVLYMLEQDFQWYQKRITPQKEKRKNTIECVYRRVLDAQTRMLTPVAPHLCEELWEMMGGKGFVSLASWPTADESMLDTEVEENEALVKDVLEDTLNIVKATGMTPKKIHYYTACPWKWKVYLKMLEKASHGEVKMSEVMKELVAEDDLKKNMKEVANFAQKTLKEVNRIPQDRREKVLRIKTLNEKTAIEDADDLLKQRLKAQIMVYDEEDSQRYDPKNKAALSTPFKPAIYIE